MSNSSPPRACLMPRFVFFSLSMHAEDQGCDQGLGCMQLVNQPNSVYVFVAEYLIPGQLKLFEVDRYICK